MLCLKHRKSLKGRKPKKIISLPSVKKNTRQKSLLAECQKKTLEILCRVSKKTLGKNSLPSVFFAEFFSRGTRERASLPSAR